MYRLLHFFLLTLLLACGAEPTADDTSTANDREAESDRPAEVQNDNPPLRYAVEYLEDEAIGLFGETPEFELLFGGMAWSEGPLWLPEQQTIICSDVPNNRILAWNEADGHRTWLEKSGSAPDAPDGTPGSNGLILDQEGRLVLCQHGSRRLARMSAPLDDPAARWEVLADRYEGQRFNSPNDLDYDSSGVFYFTDPPYGLPEQDDDPAKEIDVNGVYRLDADGEVTLLISDLRRPNGVGLSPDGRTLYVANSDTEYPIIRAYALTEEKTVGETLWTLDLTDRPNDEQGLPDGLEVARDGRIFATGPGGVWVIGPDGTPLARARTGLAIANVELDAKEEYLYMTSDPYLVRVKLP